MCQLDQLNFFDNSGILYTQYHSKEHTTVAQFSQNTRTLCFAAFFPAVIRG